MLYCNICGHAEDESLVEHINETHDGLKSYYSTFPSARVVSKKLFGEILSLSKNGSRVSTKAKPTATVNGIKLPQKNGGELVPQLDSEYHFPDETIDAIHAIEENLNLYLTGPTGTGKSSLILQLASRMNWNCTRVNLNNQFSVSDFVGRWIVEGKSMRYSYGVLSTAMREGHILLLDEITAADPGILLTLQSVLEGNPLVLTDNDGEVITRHPDFRIVATDNTKGTDAGMNSLYQGRMNQDASLLDRFQVMLEIDYLPAKVESKLLRDKTGLPKKMTDAITKLSVKVRNAIRNDELFCTFSTRQTLAFASYIKKTGDLDRAARVTILNRLDDESKRVVGDMIQLMIPRKE